MDEEYKLDGLGFLDVGLTRDPNAPRERFFDLVGEEKDVKEGNNDTTVYDALVEKEDDETVFDDLPSIDLPSICEMETGVIGEEVLADLVAPDDKPIVSDDKLIASTEKLIVSDSSKNSKDVSLQSICETPTEDIKRPSERYDEIMSPEDISTVETSINVGWRRKGKGILRQYIGKLDDEGEPARDLKIKYGWIRNPMKRIIEFEVYGRKSILSYKVGCYFLHGMPVIETLNEEAKDAVLKILDIKETNIFEILKGKKFKKENKKYNESDLGKQYPLDIKRDLDLTLRYFVEFVESKKFRGQNG